VNEPIWISLELASAIHERQLAEHGGPEGIRDQGMLESALGRARQQFAYSDPAPDFPSLAAAYAYGIARNHPFVDGNKRTAAVLCEVFLELNGYRLVADDADLYPIFMALAAGEIEEDELADWLRSASRPEHVSEAQAGYA
jgi:death-on-curing protein